MFNLNEEKKHFLSKDCFVGGIDEVGRGALAGPVVAACVAISNTNRISRNLLKDINDSKLLTPKKRESLYFRIKKEAGFVGVAMCSHKIVDEINILNASLRAMRDSVLILNKKPEYLLIDGNKKIIDLKINQKTIIGGDAKIFCIAAASIIAKVERDRLMDDYDKTFPEYDFDKNKGYGTKKHFEMIEKFGPCLIHRKTFSPIKEMTS